MAVPKRRVSRSRRDKRRSHHALTPPNYVLCPRCAEPKLPHYICPNCGYYKDRQVVLKED